MTTIAIGFLFCAALWLGWRLVIRAAIVACDVTAWLLSGLAWFFRLPAQLRHR